MYVRRKQRKNGGYKKAIFCVYSHYVPKEMSQKGHREIMNEKDGERVWKSVGREGIEMERSSGK